MELRRLLGRLNELVGMAYDEGETRALVEMLVCETCSLSRTEFVLRRSEEVADDVANVLVQRAVRLSTGEPIQYVLGYADFMGLRLAVSPDVLIPRPETAELVEWIAADAATAGASGPRTAIDLCTGSGCIALGLATLINGLHLLAADLSTGALTVARANAERLKVSRIDFMAIDVLKASARSFPPSYQHVDIIVSNPPYIRQGERASMDHNVTDYEPAMALFVPDDDALVFYRAVARLALEVLRPGGSLYFELNAATANDAVALMRSLGYADVELRHDQFGLPRMLRARIGDTRCQH